MALVSTQIETPKDQAKEVATDKKEKEALEDETKEEKEDK
jgi:hypothetical protein